MDLRDVFSRVWTSFGPHVPPSGATTALARGRLAFVMSSCYYNVDFPYQD